MEKDKYSLLKERIVDKTGIETITITIEALSLIVDDYSIPECLVHVGNYYGAMAVYEGDNSKVGITEQDLIDFNILQPIEIDNDIHQIPMATELTGNEYVYSIPEITWKHPGLADSTIESLNREHVEFYTNYGIGVRAALMEIDKECEDKDLYKTDTILDEKDGSKYYLSGPATDVENHNIKNDEKLAIDINLNINDTYGAKHSSEFPKDARISKTSDIEDLLNERRMAKINLSTIPLHTTDDIPMFDPTMLEQIALLARQTGNKFKLNNLFNELISKQNYTLDDIKKEDIISGKELSNVDWHKHNVENNKLDYLRYNLESIEPAFIPKKEILKIFNKLIEQFKNITKKDFKRLRTYVISGKDDYYHINYGNELNMVLHYMKLNLPIGTTLIHLDNLIVDIRRIILEGKPTIKFNLNIEEFNLFKKWLLDNSERIKDE